MNMNMTDDQLITLSRKGDHEAFRELIRKYESRVAATVISMLGHGPDAEDVGQEVFIRFYNSLSSFRGDSSVATYLTRIAMNLSLNMLKSRKRRALRFWEKSVEEHKDLADESITEYNGDRELIHNAVQSLEPAFRSVIVLRLMEGYSTRETADILNIPEGTVLSRLARAQKKLKDLLSPYFGENYERVHTRPAASVV